MPRFPVAILLTCGLDDHYLPMTQDNQADQETKPLAFLEEYSID